MTHKSTFQAACAEVDITPTLPITLAGSLNVRTAQRIGDPLFARLLLMSGNGTSLFFILLDLIGISNDDATHLRQQIAGDLNIPLEHICVACTHTHSAPTSVDSFDSVPERTYLDQVLLKIHSAATGLPAQLQPAEVAWGMGHEGRPQYNRRFIMRDGTLRTNPGAGNPEILHPAGPTDPMLPLLMIRQADAAPLAVLASYSLHYVGADGSDVVSADYFGAFARQIKERFGAQCTALLAHGFSGDINNVNAQQLPEPWFPASPTPEQKRDIIAAMLASQVQRVWQAASFKSTVELVATKSTFTQQVRKIDPAEIAHYTACAEDATLPLMERVFAREKLRLLDYPDALEMPQLAWRVGDWAMATFTGQLFAQFALDLRYASPFAVTAPVELANGWGGYVGRHFDYHLGGYEMQLARSSFTMPGAGEAMLQLALQMLAHLRTSNAAPATRASGPSAG